MITRFEAEAFGCIRSAGLDLTPLHALIGPNDSGKSTLLRAIAALVNGNQTVWRAGDAGVLTAIWSTSADRRGGLRRTGASDWAVQSNGGEWAKATAQAVKDACEAIGFAKLVRFDADELKRPSVLLSAEAAARFPTARGGEIAGVYDAILSSGDDSFGRIAREIRELFPTVANLRLFTTENQTKQLGVRLVDGTEVAAPEMSQGLLYYLAYLALREVNGARILLVEEPEIGLHPARIREVVQVLRKLSEGGTQVIVTTHSPLVINELRADEVTIVTRTTEEGTRLTPMSQTTHFADRSRVYQLGELWLSYADGTLEGELLGPS